MSAGGHTVAVVTGASSGIGRATALKVAAGGARVFLTGRNERRLAEVAEEIAAAGGEADIRTANLAEPEAAGAVVAAAVGWAGGLTTVINCAGSFPGTPFAELPDSEWDEAINLNLSAPMRLFRAAVPHIEAAGGGVLATVSSINAHLGDAVSVCSHYAAAKAGQEALVRQLAVELAPSGIRVVAVAPGAVDTPMIEGWADGPGEREAWLERYVPLGRIAQPQDIANALAFLVSPEAAYITGQTLMVDGGMSIV